MSQPVSETVELPHGPTPVLWRRSARARRVSLRIDPRASAVVVTLPARAARSAGLRLLTDHSDWVGSKLAALPPPLGFADGAAIPVCGYIHMVRHVPHGRGGAWIEAGEIHVAGDAAFMSRRVTDLLRAEARRSLSALVGLVSAQTGLRPSKLAIRDTKSRWGSCTADGTVMFNWRLVMAPESVQHYVVVHELAHLRHMNHGSAFWALVETHAPDMQAAIAWLKRNGVGLMRAGVVQ
jgi:predicted metal-dependent hydrolase